MPFAVPDPSIEVADRIRQIKTARPGFSMDEQELAERTEAAGRYAGENEKHFVDYCYDCVSQSLKANDVTRRTQKKCYEMYLEREPSHYRVKEDWQSKIVVPKPFATVQFAMAAVKKAFQPRFLTITNSRDEEAAAFWEKLMEHQNNEQHGRFRQIFTDATGMALAVGQSMEIIPRWKRNEGLRYSLIEPWKIFRDPDAVSRDPQSGLFWIHQEWLDYFVLQAEERAGRYVNVARVTDTSGSTTPEKGDSLQELRQLRGEVYHRSKFRKLIPTYEFWGIVLSPKAELLLPNATYTVATEYVIALPRPAPYRTLRWPGVSFSPLPDLLRFGGRGLLEGVASIWEFMNNLMCLHADYENWIVNPMVEICVDGLIDETDVETRPGKEFLTRALPTGHQQVRTVDRRFISHDILANMQYADQNFQRGTFITDAVQGLPGYRKDMTWRESAMLLEQALGVFSLIGENLERGAIDVLNAAADCIERNITINELEQIFGVEAQKYINPDSPTGVTIPRLDGSFHISGLSTIVREAETMRSIRELLLPLSEQPVFSSYINRYRLLKAIEERANLVDENLLVDERTAQQIDRTVQQMVMQAAAQQMLQSGEVPKGETGTQD